MPETVAVEPTQRAKAVDAITKEARPAPLTPANQRAEDRSRQEPGFLAAQRETNPANTAIIKGDHITTEPETTEPDATSEGEPNTPSAEEQPAAEAQPSPEVTDNPEAEMPQHSPRFLYLVNAGKFEDGSYENTPLNDKPEKAYHVIDNKSMDIRRRIQQEKYGNLTFEENQERWAQVWVNKFSELAKAPNSALFFKTLSEKVGITIDTTRLLDPATQAEEGQKLKDHLKGEFFEEYCQQDGLSKLADKLTVEDAVVLRTFIRGVYGGGNQLLYDSVVATVAAKGEFAKAVVTAEAVQQSHLSDREKEILAYLNGEEASEVAEQPLAAAEASAVEPRANAPPQEEEKDEQKKASTQTTDEGQVQTDIEVGGSTVAESLPDDQKEGLAALKTQLETSETSLSSYYTSCNQMMKELGIKGDAQKMIEGKNPKDIAELQAKLSAYYRELGLFRSGQNGDSVTAFFNSSSTGLAHLDPSERAKLLFAALENRRAVRDPSVQERLNNLRTSLETLGFSFIPTLQNKDDDIIHQDALVDAIDKKLHTFGKVDVTRSVLDIIHAADTFELTPTVQKMMRENGRTQQLDQYKEANIHEEPLAA